MWEIYAYHNTDSLVGIFNAIAAIMASGTYLSAIAAVAFCGFVAAMVAYMLAPEKLQGWKWIGTVVLVYGVLFVPRVTVGIVDKTGGTPVHVVANVPFGMAALGGLSSSIGNSITELFETAFQILPGPGALPAELAYQQNGLMFGSRLLQETRRASLPDPAVRTDLINFVGNCTAFDIADGTISPTAFSTSADLWATMAATNPARFSIVTSGSGVTTTTCDQVYASINSRLPAQVTDLTNRLGQRLNPTLSALAAQAAVVNQIPQAYIRSQIASASSTAADLVRQNALINAINDAGEMGCQKINDPSCMMLATGRAAAIASQNAAWINGAKIAEQALPVVRNVAEAICYAVFPLIVLLLFLSSGRTTLLMLAGYAAALISIQLWPPLFAILNYMASIYAQLDQAAAAEIGGGVKALSLQTASPIYSNSVSAQAVVSYLVIGIPLLAYSLANRLVNFGSTLVGGLTGLQSTVGNASSAAALGNSSMGNVSMDQRVVSPSTSNPWVSKSQDERGNWWTEDAAGRRAVSLLRNEGITSHQVSAKVSQSDVEAASRTASSAAADVVNAGTMRAATLSEALTRARQHTSSSRASAGQSFSAYLEVSKAAEQLTSESKRIASETGYSEDQVASALLRFQAIPSAYGIGGGAAVEKRYGVSLSEAEKKILDHSTASSYRVARSFGDRASTDRAFLNALSTEGQSGTSLASSLSSSATRSESAEQRYSEALVRSEELRIAHEQGLSFTRDLAADPANSAAVVEYERAADMYRGSPQALAAHMASMLGNMSFTPTRFSGATALPSSFGDVRSVHLNGANEPTLNPDLASRRAANDQAVRAGPVTSVPPAPAAGRPGSPEVPSSPDPRKDVNPDLHDSGRFRAAVEGAQRSRDQANQQEYESFDARHEIDRSRGGLATHQSMVGRAAGGLKRDAETTFDDATEAGRRAMEEAKQRAASSPRQKAIDATSEVPAMRPNAGKRSPDRH
jgi:conjugal transfer mating pair stabilization protein TraG